MDFFQRRLSIFAPIPNRQSYTGGSLIRRAVCGNGIVEPGEDCDCDQSNDSARCSDLNTYGCCDLLTCKFRPYETVCRQMENVCDRAEFCSGDSAKCGYGYDEWWREGWWCATPKGETGYWGCYNKECVRRPAEEQEPPEGPEVQPPPEEEVEPVEEETTIKSESKPKTTTTALANTTTSKPPAVNPTTDEPTPAETQKETATATETPRTSPPNRTDNGTDTDDKDAASPSNQLPKPSNPTTSQPSTNPDESAVAKTLTTTDPSGHTTTLTTLPTPTTPLLSLSTPPTGYTKTTIISIAVASSLGVLLVTILALFLFFRWKKKHSSPTAAVLERAELEDTGRTEIGVAKRGYGSGSTVVGELVGDDGAVEVEGGGMVERKKGVEG